MYSKFLCPSYRLLGLNANRLLLNPTVNPVHPCKTRSIFGLIPKSQYDVPFPKRLKLSYAMRVYWEIIPVVAVTTFALSLMFGSIAWAVFNKVDVVFKSHSRDNISHTMDLRKPTCHKLITIDQKYEPWIEMAELIEKVQNADKRYADEKCH